MSVNINIMFMGGAHVGKTTIMKRLSGEKRYIKKSQSKPNKMKQIKTPRETKHVNIIPKKMNVKSKSLNLKFTHNNKNSLNQNNRNAHGGFNLRGFIIEMCEIPTSKEKLSLKDVECAVNILDTNHNNSYFVFVYDINKKMPVKELNEAIEFLKKKNFEKDNVYFIANKKDLVSSELNLKFKTTQQIKFFISKGIKLKNFYVCSSKFIKDKTKKKILKKTFKKQSVKTLDDLIKTICASYIKKKSSEFNKNDDANNKMDLIENCSESLKLLNCWF